MSGPDLSANHDQVLSVNSLIDTKRKREESLNVNSEESDSDCSEIDLEAWPEECFIESNSLPLPWIYPHQLFIGHGWDEIDLQLLIDMGWAEIDIYTEWPDAPPYVTDSDTDTSDYDDMPPLEDVTSESADGGNESDQTDFGIALRSLFTFHNALSTFEDNIR